MYKRAAWVPTMYITLIMSTITGAELTMLCDKSEVRYTCTGKTNSLVPD